MEQTFYSIHDYYISHHGIKGQKWGVRRFQNPDGTLTELGKKRYGTVENMQRSIHAGRMSFAKSTAASVVGTAAMSAATKSFTPMIYGVSPTAKTYRKDLEADTGAKNLTKNIFKSIVKTAVLSAGMSLIKGRPTLKLAIQLGPTYSKIKDKKIGEIDKKNEGVTKEERRAVDPFGEKLYSAWDKNESPFKVKSRLKVSDLTPEDADKEVRRLMDQLDKQINAEVKRLERKAVQEKDPKKKEALFDLSASVSSEQDIIWETVNEQNPELMKLAYKKNGK